MILSDKDIRWAQRHYQVVSPFVDAHVQPASYEVTLADDYLWQTDMTDDPWFNPMDSDVQFVPRKWSQFGWIDPGNFILATTIESVKIPPNLVAQVNGKSSLGRKGLTVHVTAGFVDPGFEGQITLELANLSQDAIPLKPGQKIAQLAFFAMTSHAEFPYGHEVNGNHYQGQRGATESAL